MEVQQRWRLSHRCITVRAVGLGAEVVPGCRLMPQQRHIKSKLQRSGRSRPVLLQLLSSVEKVGQKNAKKRRESTSFVPAQRLKSSFSLFLCCIFHRVIKG